MAKRSPILGYNHNVRYRGLVWHVQTEDSGMANPHLFTHLFHEGVIVSTRKLVYDNGSDEGAIKSLMQAQHKAVMKDLKRGHFDDKIDVYLKDTPGLLPRGGVEEGASTDGESTKPEGFPKVAAVPTPPPTGIPAPAPRSKQLASVDSSAEIRLEVDGDARDSIPYLEVEADEPGLDDAPIGDSGAFKTEAPRRRKGHDTEVSPTDVPNIVIDDATRKNLVGDGVPNTMNTGESIPHLLSASSIRPTGERASVGAATLPAARAITRPPTSRPTAIATPTVTSRPLTDARTRAESEAVEVYSPAPPSVELPPGERPGHYAVHRKTAAFPAQTEPLPRARSQSQPIPPMRGKPRTVAPTGQQSTIGQPSDRIPTLPPPPSVPSVIRHEPPSSSHRARTPTPARIPTAPSRPNPSSGGVVMTRPAVIVGAPTRSVTQRVRKAREDEGRGFGQGLISEKSLDEVILAYLSEDADEK